MKTQKYLYNKLVLFYNKCKRRLINLKLKNYNLRKQGILLRHLQRLQIKLSTMQVSFNTLRYAGTLALAALAFDNLQAQNFASQVSNPLGLTPITGYNSSPAFADLDNDGDMDMVSGSNNYGDFSYFENTGDANSANFISPVNNPFGLISIGYLSDPTFVDLDNDGDMDLLSGENYGNYYYFENTGTASSPAFASPITNPFGLTGYSNHSSPTFADLDNDGDFDLIAGFFTGSFKYYENTGTATTPAFASGITNPFGLIDIGARSKATFIDLDFDGDMDLMCGEFGGSFMYFQNTGSETLPTFAAPLTNPFGITFTSRPNPDFVDIDGDADMDLVSGYSNNDFIYYENICASATLGNISNISGLDNVCLGLSTNYDVVAVSGATTYEWILPNGWTGTSTTNSITTTPSNTSGNVQVIAQLGCKGRKASKFVNVYSGVPAIPSTISGTSIICSGTTETYSVIHDQNAASYTWTLPSGWTGSSVSNSISATANATSGTILVNASNACGNSGNNSLSVIAGDANSGTDVQASCNDLTWIDGNTYTASNNTATYTLTNSTGCDSIVTLDYTKLVATSGTDVQIACNSFHWIDGNTYTASTTSPTYTLTNAVGCDSVVTLNLTIHSLPVVTTNTNGLTITANETGSSYQWINCATGAMIIGQTNQSYTATANGNYAVIIDNGNCVDTSACVTINTVGIDQTYDGNQLVIYPNPNNGDFTIQTSLTGNFIIQNELGQVVYTFQSNTENNRTVSMNGLANGLYFISGENTLVPQKIIVAK